MRLKLTRYVEAWTGFAHVKIAVTYYLGKRVEFPEVGNVLL